MEKSSTPGILNFFKTEKGALAALVLLFVLGVVFTVWVIDANVYGPIHFNDEVEYWDITKSMYSGTFTFAESYHYPPFYSMSLLPAFYLFGPLSRYAAIKWLNAIYLTSAIFPAYLLLRKFTSRGISLLAVFVLLVNPITVVIPRCLLSENVFYPLLMWAVLLAFTDIFPQDKRSRIIENLIFGALLALLILTRFIALVVVPALLLIWWLKPRSGAKLSSLLITKEKMAALLVVLIPMLLILGAWIWFGMGDGVPFMQLIGFSIADDPNPAQLGKRRLLMWAVFYGCYTLLMAAPFMPVLLPALTQFKLKEWQKDENRWWIALLLILLSFLVPCIRHSWRAAYNYPDPVKLQGRYVLYFGPLFLLTAFASLKRLGKVEFKHWHKLGLAVLACGLIGFGYAVLFDGFIYLDNSQLGAAVNAPYGNMMRTMQQSYLLLSLLNVVAGVILLGRDTAFRLAYITLFLIGFYTYGSARVYQRILMSRQLLNSQVYNLSELMQTLPLENDEGIDFSQLPIDIKVPDSSTARYIRSWHRALELNGYLAHTIEVDESLDDEASLIFQASFETYTYKLRELNADAYQKSQAPKYSFAGKYYQYELIQSE